MTGIRRRVVLASLLGAGALGAGIGLLATSAWLISRAAQHPPESALALAIVAVQLFGLSKGLLRYAQRLVGHDAALRAQSDLRVSVYRRLEPLAPAGLTAFRSGDLIARFVHDVESLQDLVVRVIVPLCDRDSRRHRHGRARVVDPSRRRPDPAARARARRDRGPMGDRAACPAQRGTARRHPRRADRRDRRSRTRSVRADCVRVRRAQARATPERSTSASGGSHSAPAGPRAWARALPRRCPASR